MSNYIKFENPKEIEGFSIYSINNELEHEKRQLLKDFFYTYFPQIIGNASLKANLHVTVLNLTSLEILTAPQRINIFLESDEPCIIIDFGSERCYHYWKQSEIEKYHCLELSSPEYTLAFHKGLEQLTISDSNYKIILTPII